MSERDGEDAVKAERARCEDGQAATAPGSQPENGPAESEAEA